MTKQELITQALKTMSNKEKAEVLNNFFASVFTKEKLEEIKRLKTLQQERLQLTNEPSLSSSHKKSEKQNAQKK